MPNQSFHSYLSQIALSGIRSNQSIEIMAGEANNAAATGGVFREEIQNLQSQFYCGNNWHGS